MSIEQMWERLAQHQPFADERGYGEAWRRMCEERTEEAAWTATEAVEELAFATLAETAAYASKAADAAGWAVWGSAVGWMEGVNWWAEYSIDGINKAEGKYANS
jgi:hypothetical protein